MKRFASKTQVPQQSAQDTQIASPQSSPGSPIFDVQLLLDKTGIILDREIRNLLTASASGKLDAALSRDLVSYIKLLSELKAEQQNALESLTDEELLAYTKKD